jgi:hypothetical protein
MISLILVAVATLVSQAPRAGAQSSEMFVREGQSLMAEGARLTKTRTELQERGKALSRELETLGAKRREIVAMRPGIGRDAAWAGYKRDMDNLQWRVDDFQSDCLRERDNFNDYSRRVGEYNRRVQAARAANRFQPGQRVQVEWRGQWWSAVVLRAENGSYYVTYPGYGREWNEWVGPGRIR